MIHLYIIWKNLKFKNFNHLFFNCIDYTNFLLAVIHKPSYFSRWFSISFILILIRDMAIIEMLSHSIFIEWSGPILFFKSKFLVRNKFFSGLVFWQLANCLWWTVQIVYEKENYKFNLQENRFSSSLSISRNVLFSKLILWNNVAICWKHLETRNYFVLLINKKIKKKRYSQQSSELILISPSDTMKQL